jgi:1-acyl-sn-glycerol-3-phosphate acyltransferase
MDRLWMRSPMRLPAMDRSPLKRSQARIARLTAHLVSLWATALVAPALDRERRRAVVERWARETLALLDVSVSLRGTPPPVDEPVLLVANHVSWLDICALNATGGARFVAKAEVARWPVLGRITRGYGSFPLVRGSFRSAYRVKNAAADALRGGDRVGAFPEGTTTDGYEVRPFHPALLQAAIDAGVRVQPVAIRYPDALGRPNPAAVFIDDMTFVDSIRRILASGGLAVELSFCEAISPLGRTRRELAHRARQAIIAALESKPRRLPAAA